HSLLASGHEDLYSPLRARSGDDVWRGDVRARAAPAPWRAWSRGPRDPGPPQTCSDGPRQRSRPPSSDRAWAPVARRRAGIPTGDPPRVRSDALRSASRALAPLHRPRRARGAPTLPARRADRGASPPFGPELAEPIDRRPRDEARRACHHGERVLAASGGE